METVCIERMSYGADAVGHLASGKTVFVHGGIPGEHAEVCITEEKPRFAKGYVPGRQVASVAPWELLPYEQQLKFKAANVRDALLRVAHLDVDDVERILHPIVSCKDEWGYRNKLELAAAEDAQGRFSLGFHEADSAAVDIVASCGLGNRLIKDSPKALTGALRYLAGGADLGIYRIGVRGSLATKSVEVALWTPPGPFPRTFAAKMLEDAVGATSVVRVIADEGSARKVKRVEMLAGDGFWLENLIVEGSPIVYQVSAPSFFQVNTKQAAKLVALVLDAIKPTPQMRIADLYSGVGAFTVPLARVGAHTVAIELEGSAARDLRANCIKNNVDIDVICDDVARALPGVAQAGLDVLLVDPPRAGLGKRVIAQIADAHPAKIVYVSCDPQTLARDVARFASRGYKLASTTPVDLFPQTYHVETVSIFC